MNRIAQTRSTRRAVKVVQILPLRGQERTPCCSPGTTGISREELDSLLPLLLSVYRLCGGFVQVMGNKPGSIVTSRAVLTW